MRTWREVRNFESQIFGLQELYEIRQQCGDARMNSDWSSQQHRDSSTPEWIVNEKFYFRFLFVTTARCHCHL